MPPFTRAEEFLVPTLLFCYPGYFTFLVRFYPAGAAVLVWFIPHTLPTFDSALPYTSTRLRSLVHLPFCYPLPYRPVPGYLPAVDCDTIFLRAH